MSGRESITTELRAKLDEYEPQETGDAFVTRQVGRTGYDAMIAMCDSIDAVHANLERENAELKAELDRMLGEQEEHTHTKGKSITDELREYVNQTPVPKARVLMEVRDRFNAIADRIDAEHQKAIRELNNFADASVPLPGGTVIQKLNGGRPVILQTFDRHYVIVNPDQIPAMVVYDV